MSLDRPAKKGNKYINTIPTDDAGFDKMAPIIREYIKNKAQVVPVKKMGPFTTELSVYQNAPENGLRVTWVGHSSLLIEIDGYTILTDPVWSNRVSFTQFMGPQRFFQPPIALRDLPAIDAIICSHDHYDHLDMATIKFFAGSKISFFCSLGVGQYLQKWGIGKEFITEMDWGDSVMLGQGCVITAAPARHFSGRGVLNRNETLWSSFVIKGSQHKIYFGADSGWHPQFAEIGEAYGPFDLTMLEVGAYGKYWPDIHMGPDNASSAHVALKGELMMPIHWGTFNLALHDWYEPVELLIKYAAEKNIDLFLPEPGNPTEVNGAFNSEWWRRYM